MDWWNNRTRKKRVGPDFYRKGRIGRRIRCRGIVAAEVKGRNGTYAVFGNPRSLDCTCLARQMPCPHALAVRADFEEAAGRFADLLQAAPAGANLEELLERELLQHPERVLEAYGRGALEALAASLARREGPARGAA